MYGRTSTGSQTEFQYLRSIDPFVYAFYMGPGFYLFSAIRIYLSQICLPLFQERKGNIFLRPVIIGQKPYKPFLLLTPGHDYPLTRMSGKHLGIIKYRRQVLKPFYFRFSLISRRFIVPEKGLQRTVKYQRSCQLMGMCILQTLVIITDGVVCRPVYHTRKRQNGVVRCIRKLLVS